MRTLEEAIEEETQAQKEFLYLEHEKKSGLKVGDEVKVTRIATSHELGWKSSWVHSYMNEKVGQTGKITNIKTDGQGIHVLGWDFPFFVLEKVKTTPTIEFLMPDETWEKSECDEDDIQGFTLVTDTDEYYYYHDNGTMLYRVEKLQPE